MGEQLILRGRRRLCFGSAPAIAILVSGFVFLHFGCGRSADEGPPISSPEIESGERMLEITVFPRDGEVIRDLDRSVVVEFSMAVNPEDFSFEITPDPGGWEPAWHGTRHRVELRHADPFQADTEYELEVVLTSGPKEVVRFTAARPSTLQLIDAAEVAGEIDLDTAWTYRLQFVFEPQLVPEPYRSSAPVHDVDGVMRDFVRVRSSLSPETIADLRRYTVRPDHPESVFFRVLGGRALARAERGDRGRMQPGDHVETDADLEDEDRRPSPMVPEDCSEHLRVWSAPDQRWTAQRVCGMIQQYSIYERFFDLLGREPLEDTDACFVQGPPIDGEDVQPCLEMKGGDERLDIYLVPEIYVVKGASTWAGVCISEQILYGDKSTAFIVVKLASDLDDLTSTIAHEIFHAFQFAFDYFEDLWWMEATAVWSEEFINSKWDNERWLEYAFQQEFHRLDPLTDEDGLHEYGIYLFPYYLEKIRPGREQVIADIWKGCEEKNSLEAIDAALGGKLDTTFRHFALVNLDHLTYEDSYPEPLDLYEYHKAESFPLDVTNNHEIRLEMVLPPLSAYYVKIQNNVNPDDTPLVRFHLDDFARNKNLSIVALINYFEDQPVEEDWHDLTRRDFCIARESEHFSDMHLVISSTERKSLTFPTLTVSGESECERFGGSGSFSVKMYRQSNGYGGTFRFDERVTGQVTLGPFDSKNGEFPGRASVQLFIETETHIPYNKDEYITIEGSGEVECVLSYPFGNEDADYSLNCGMLPITRTRRTVKQPEGIEETVVGSGTTDIDEWCIGSHTGGKPARYQTELSGTYNDPKSGDGSSHSCTWSIHLDAPER
ncbi:MAG: hypothetical protein OQK55_03700 [Thermoanaerobaculales bacterium]|nr:hypothetical protein [Thermoanaerobaculales bacterium]